MMRSEPKRDARRTRLACAVVGALALLTARASAQQDAAADGGSASGAQRDSSAVIDEVVVRGRRLSEIEFDIRDYITDFVVEVAASPPGRGYARWRDRVCVGVHNLRTAAAQYLVDRISRLALDMGLEPGEPGCAPEVIIVFATDADAVASDLVENEPRLFRPVAGHAGMNLPLAALDRFRQSDEPVRWWHVSMPVDARTGQPAIKLPGSRRAPVVAVAGPSRIHSGISDDLRRAIIIVDVEQISGLTWEQLGDYLALISLAQIEPDANPAAFDSILNLFRTPEYYSGLTDWDRSYLRALYTFDQERYPELQRSAVVDRIARQEREVANGTD